MICSAEQVNRSIWIKFRVLLLVLMVRSEEDKLPPRESCRLRSRLAQFAENLRLRMDSVIGTHTIMTYLSFCEMLLQFVAEGAAGGLNVITVSMAEVLRASGFGDPVFIPHFTPEGLTSAAQWMLLTVISYFLFRTLLRLAITIIRRSFWMLKIVMVMWIFCQIISDPKASSETTVSRLFLLVLFMALWSVTTVRTGTNLETRLSNLEDRIAAMDKKTN